MRPNTLPFRNADPRDRRKELCGPDRNSETSALIYNMAADIGTELGLGFFRLGTRSQIEPANEHARAIFNRDPDLAHSLRSGMVPVSAARICRSVESRSREHWALVRTPLGGYRIAIFTVPGLDRREEASVAEPGTTGDVVRFGYVYETEQRPEPPGTTTRLSRHSRPLTQREREVLRCLSTGASNAEVATQLGVSEHTVRRHTEQIFRKLGVKSRTAAALHYVRCPLD